MSLRFKIAAVCGFIQTNGQTDRQAGRQRNKHGSIDCVSDVEQEFIHLKCSARAPSACNIHWHEIDNLP